MPLADWTGVLTRTDAITGKLVCSLTWWRLALTGTPGGRGCVHLTGTFEGEVFGADAPPWTEEADIAGPHERKGHGYECLWVGTIRNDDGDHWYGELADFYRHRLLITGTTKEPGVIALRATTGADA